MWMRLIAIMTISAVFAGAVRAEVREKPLSVNYDANTQRLTVQDAAGKLLLTDGVVELHRDGQVIGSSSSADTRARSLEDHVLELTLGDDLRAQLRADGNRIVISTHVEDASLRSEFGYALNGRAINALGRDHRETDRNVLTMTLGPATVPGAFSIFNIDHDLLLTAEAGQVHWQRASEEANWRLKADGPRQITVQVTPNYYREHLGITYYTPIEKRSFWTTAPMVCMTWYGICGDKQPQNRELLKPEIDWAAEHLLPYAGRLVFQLDDNYDYADDEKMLAFSRYIRSKGLIPGIWLTPFSMLPPERDQELGRTHPDWFLQDETGKLLTSFAGRNWGWTEFNQEKRWQFNGFAHTINVTHSEAREKVYKPAWRTVSDTWDYDFFKIDGQNQGVIQAYRESVNGGGIEGYRLGLETARQIIGPDKFINACWGVPVPLEAIGLAHGSRTGGDTGRHQHAANVVIEHNYLNNVVWWNDPDAAAVLYNKPVHHARINATMRVLTGQQFLTDDYWTKIPDPIRRIWQQALPTLDIHPANLYRISDGNQQHYDLFNLRIAKAWGTYDVAAVFNYDEQERAKTLDLSRLPLDARRVHVYAYFSQSYLGAFDHDAELERRLEGPDAEVFAIVPVESDRPELLSTSRHISQGGLDLAALEYVRDAERWLVRGESTHLVAGDPYQIVFHTDDFIVDGEIENANVDRDGPITRVTWTPETSGNHTWAIRFKPVTP